MAFIYVADGIDDVLAAHLNQYADAWSGVAGKGQPFNAVAVNDPINFAISARNLDPTNSRAAQFLKADGTVLFQVDASGVKVSPDGTTASVPVTATATQTLTNKTFTAPHMTGPVVDSGGLTVTAGGLTVGGAIAGTGTGGFGAWTTFVPTAGQGATAPTLTVTYASYVILGKIVIVGFAVTLTSAGAAGSAIQLSLPAAVSARSVGLNGARAVFTYHTATTYYTGSGWLVNAGNDMQFTVSGQTGQLGATPSFAVANGDTLSATGVWELL